MEGATTMFVLLVSEAARAVRRFVALLAQSSIMTPLPSATSVLTVTPSLGLPQTNLRVQCTDALNALM